MPRKLGRPTDQRNLMLRSMATAFIENGKLVTTEMRAKELRPIVEKLITLGKKNTLHTRRQALAYMTKPGAVEKLFSDVAPKFAERNGGYTRIIKMSPRRGDAAPMAVISLVD